MFHRSFKHSKTIKARGRRPSAFISFLAFGNPDETLALVFEILRQISQINRSTKGCVDGFRAYYSITNEYVNISRDQSRLLVILFNVKHFQTIQVDKTNSNLHLQKTI